IYDTGRVLFETEKGMLATGVRLLGLTVTDFEEHPVENLSLDIFENK
ncbi:MAG: DNA polymerase IV, partial [Lactobacillus paragasseri]